MSVFVSMLSLAFDFENLRDERERLRMEEIVRKVRVLFAAMERVLRAPIGGVGGSALLKDRFLRDAKRDLAGDGTGVAEPVEERDLDLEPD